MGISDSRSRAAADGTCLVTFSGLNLVQAILVMIVGTVLSFLVIGALVYLILALATGATRDVAEATGKTASGETASGETA
jgi:hypothetical protein